MGAKGEKKDGLTKEKEAALKVAKEVVVKLIEAGRLGPEGFDRTFKLVFRSVLEALESPSDASR